MQLKGEAAQGDPERSGAPMKISIEYCGTCNYRPIAASLGMTIEKVLELKPELVHSREMGAFEVKVDDELVFSKKETKVFPNHEEIVELLKTWKERTKK